MIRIDQLLSRGGLCSKKRAQDFLDNNDVKYLNRKILFAGDKVDSDKEKIFVNGVQIEIEEKVYYLLNKPKGVVTTNSDEFNRPTIISLIPEKKRIFPVGRLDENTSGLIILTNDGEFSNKLTHPKYHLAKTYQLTIEGFVPRPVIKKLEEGVLLKDGLTAPAKVKMIGKEQGNSILEITIFEGRNRQLRRMCGKLNLQLLDLKRVAIGNLRDENLGTGKFRKLTNQEVSSLTRDINKHII